MAVKKRGKVWYAYFEPFRDRRQVGLRLDVQTKAEARRIEAMIDYACRSGDCSGLAPGAREAFIRLYQNRKWELPPELEGRAATAPIPWGELTLMRACELFMKTPVANWTPEWYRPLVWTAYMTGMRRGELLGLMRKQVNLSRRIIVLSPEDVKEARWKRVPIYKELVQAIDGMIFDHGETEILVAK